MDDDIAPPSYLPPAPTSAPPAPISSFADDPFGSSDPFAPPKPISTISNAPPAPPSIAAPLPSPVISAAKTLDIFSDDPFGSSDLFGNASMASSAPQPVLPKIAPPLTAAQLAQHAQFFQALLSTGSGYIYNDGVLQVCF
jgi:hypothetical protein